MGKIPQQKEWQPTLIFLQTEFLDRLASWATVHGVTESDVTEWLALSHFHIYMYTWEALPRGWWHGRARTQSSDSYQNVKNGDSGSKGEASCVSNKRVGLLHKTKTPILQPTSSAALPSDHRTALTRHSTARHDRWLESPCSPEQTSHRHTLSVLTCGLACISNQREDALLAFLNSAFRNPKLCRLLSTFWVPQLSSSIYENLPKSRLKSIIIYSLSIFLI